MHLGSSAYNTFTQAIDHQTSSGLGRSTTLPRTRLRGIFFCLHTPGRATLSAVAAPNESTRSAKRPGSSYTSASAIRPPLLCHAIRASNAASTAPNTSSPRHSPRVILIAINQNGIRPKSPVRDCLPSECVPYHR